MSEAHIQAWFHCNLVSTKESRAMNKYGCTRMQTQPPRTTHEEDIQDKTVRFTSEVKFAAVETLPAGP